MDIAVSSYYDTLSASDALFYSTMMQQSVGARSATRKGQKLIAIIVNNVMTKVMWADKVTTPEGYTGTVTEFSSDGTAKVVFNPTDKAPLMARYLWYKRDELLVGHEI